MPPHQGEPVDESILPQLQEALSSQAFILMKDLNHSDTFWENNSAACKLSRKLLKSIDYNFLVQVLDRHSRGETFLDLVLTNTEKIIKEVMIKGSLGCSNYALVEFLISRHMEAVMGGLERI